MFRALRPVVRAQTAAVRTHRAGHARSTAVFIRAGPVRPFAPSVRRDLPQHPRQPLKPLRPIKEREDAHHPIGVAHLHVHAPRGQRLRKRVPALRGPEHHARAVVGPARLVLPIGVAQRRRPRVKPRRRGLEPRDGLRAVLLHPGARVVQRKQRHKRRAATLHRAQHRPQARRVHARPRVQPCRAVERGQRLVRRLHPHIRPQRARRGRLRIPVEMRAVRLVAQHGDAQRPRPRRRELRPVQRAVVIRPDHQQRPRVRAAFQRLQIALVGGMAQARRRKRRPGKHHVQFRHRAQVQRGKVRVPRQNHRPAAARGVEQHGLHPCGGPAGEHQRVRRARAARRQRLRPRDRPAGGVEVVGHAELGGFQPVGVHRPERPAPLRSRHMQGQPVRHAREHLAHGPLHRRRLLRFRRGRTPAQMHPA